MSSSSVGSDFMDQYISESGGKPVESDAQPLATAPAQQQSAIPDMASLFGGSDSDASSNSNAHSDQTPAWSKSSGSSSSSSDANDDAGIFRWPSSNDHGAAARAIEKDV